MSIKDERFFKEVGARVAQLRKDQGLTQTQLAERLGIAQQTLAHYEVGRLRVAASMLPTLAQVLGTSVEELIGQPAGARQARARPAPAAAARAALGTTETQAARRHGSARIDARPGRARGSTHMTELELKLSLPDQLANQAKAAGLLTSEAIERLVREAIRKAAAERLIEIGRRLREAGGPEITEAELESELKAVRAELREARAGRS